MSRIAETETDQDNRIMCYIGKHHLLNLTSRHRRVHEVRRLTRLSPVISGASFSPEQAASRKNCQSEHPAFLEASAEGMQWIVYRV